MVNCASCKSKTRCKTKKCKSSRRKRCTKCRSQSRSRKRSVSSYRNYYSPINRYRRKSFKSLVHHLSPHNKNKYVYGYTKPPHEGCTHRFTPTLCGSDPSCNWTGSSCRKRPYVSSGQIFEGPMNDPNKIF